MSWRRFPLPARLGLAALVALAQALSAQDTAVERPAGMDVPPVVEEFLAKARAGSARYHDRAAAIADGYRAIGPDTPAMGSHWVHPVLVLADSVDPGRPAILTYTTIGARPALVGVGYAVPVRAGHQPPPLPIGSNLWHFHSGTVDDEVARASHRAMAAHERTGTRVAVLHAWIWLENPRGPFEPDNWVLPFARLGLTAPADAPPAASRAIALATVGATFYADRLVSLAGPGADATADLRGLIEASGARVTEWVERLHHTHVAPEEIEWLVSVWERLWKDIEATVDEAAWEKVRTLSGEPGKAP